jgi:hypothetical protein
MFPSNALAERHESQPHDATGMISIIVSLRMELCLAFVASGLVL